MFMSRARLAAMSHSCGGARPTTTPQVILGSKLVGFIDAEDNSKITAASGAVAAYADIISAASYAQATAGFRPAITTNAVTGRQIFRFDGTDDCLEFTSIPTGWPTGANPCEIIFIGSQNALANDGNSTRTIVSYGGSASTVNRVLRRGALAGTQNIVQSAIGNGSTNIVVSHTADFSGNHLARAIIDGTNIYAGTDGDVSGATAAVPATGTTRARIGAGSNTTAAGFYQGDLSALFVTNAVLTVAEFNALAVWAGARIWG